MEVEEAELLLLIMIMVMEVELLVVGAGGGGRGGAVAIGGCHIALEKYAAVVFFMLHASQPRNSHQFESFKQGSQRLDNLIFINMYNAWDVVFICGVL